MGNCCVNPNKHQNTEKIVYSDNEELSNKHQYTEKIVYSDNEELSKDDMNKMRKTMTNTPVIKLINILLKKLIKKIQFFYLKQNLSVGNFISSKKFFDGRQTIREIKQFKSKRKEYSGSINALEDFEDFEDFELTLEHESMIRKILFEKNIIPNDTTEDSM